MTKNIHVRHAIRADIDEMAEIYAVAFDDFQPKLSVLQYLDTPGAVSFVAELHQKNSTGIAGFLVGRVVLDEAEIFSVGVGASVRRNGCGQRLVEVFCGHAALHGAKKVFLEVAVDNEKAVPLYNKVGFTVVGRRQGYYREPNGNRTDALVMECELLRKTVSKPESSK